MGSCFATFLMLSIAWITPVQANSSAILTTLDQLSEKISEDEVFLNLLNDPDLDEFIDLILSETEEWDEQFNLEAETIANRIIEKDEFQQLVSRYETDIESLHQILSEKIIDEIPDTPEGFYYTVTDQADGLNIDKQDNPDIEGEGIVVSSSDDSIDIVGIGRLRGFFLGLFIKLLNLVSTILNLAGRVTKVVYTILSVTQFIVNIFNKPLGASLKLVVAFVSTIRTVISIVGTVVSIVSGILEIIHRIIKPRARDTRTVRTTFTRLMERINKLFQRIIIYKERLFQTTPRASSI